MPDDLPKSIKRRMRDLVAIIHERELARELEGLGTSFEAWRARTIDAWELERRIHAFDRGPAREVHLRYAGNTDFELLIARAVEEDILSEDEIADEVMPYLARAFAFFDAVRKHRK